MKHRYSKTKSEKLNSRHSFEELVNLRKREWRKWCKTRKWSKNKKYFRRHFELMDAICYSNPFYWSLIR